MSTAITDQLKEFIRENFLMGAELKDFGGDDSFLEKGIIDSTGVLELVGFIEEKFNIKVRDEDMTPDNLDSLNRLTAFIGSRTQN